MSYADHVAAHADYRNDDCFDALIEALGSAPDPCRATEAIFRLVGARGPERQAQTQEVMSELCQEVESAISGPTLEGGNPVH